MPTDKADITDAGPRLKAMNDALEASDRLQAEIARLQAENERLRSQPCPYVVGTTTKYCVLTAPTLTDAERQAMEAAIGWIESPGVGDDAMPEDYLPITATLRGLLERTK